MQARSEPIMGFEGLEWLAADWVRRLGRQASCQSFDGCFWITRVFGFYRHGLQNPMAVVCCRFRTCQRIRDWQCPIP